jgi:DinB superfamily
MKKLIFVLPVFLLAFSTIEDGLSKKEKKFAISYLEETRDDLANTISGLSEEQFNFKPADNRWSVKECLQHIAITENSLWQWCESTIKAPATPEKRAEVKTTDEQVIKMITDRSQKFQAAPEMKPEKSVFTTALDAFNGFKASRDLLIKYVKNTKEDLRNHITQGPMGSVDAYQLVLFIGAHGNRHTQQIAEVMADPNFPKK